MIEFFQQFGPITQALLGSSVAWASTALGAASIFAFKSMNKKLLDAMLGFAAGIMLAASFWSLLAPSIEISSKLGLVRWFPPLIGFTAGGIFLRLIDKILPHLHPDSVDKQPEGIKTKWHKSTLLILTLTMHNIPEGLAMGVAFGAAASGVGGATLAGAVALAIGIAIQDYPEGFAVALPLRWVGSSMRRSFFWGMMSGIVEPIGAVIGAVAVIYVQSILPYALSFAAGAMIFVTVEEVIPEAESGGNADIATTGLMIGFALMMIMEVAFGA